MKASSETHADVGDKANDAVRVDGERAALPGGRRGRQPRLHAARADRVRARPAAGSTPTRSTTSAGVNCSDHEVNIKILLDALVADGDMTVKQRNALLAEMTDAVAEQVLYGSYTQTQALSLAAGAGGADGRRPRAA